MANTRWIFGLVNADGTSDGSGFSTRRVESGHYLIDFGTNFTSQPAMVASLKGTQFKGSQSDNAVLVDTNPDNAIVRVTDLPDGGSQDGAFFFICIGHN